ncbi:hypothetical protein R1T43_11305 [Alteromonas sp. CI.11.F.A3]|uniref:hypothetical protein n=1 Tax=Alteromonas sp. CI.11.F.A3 TaxID=3079555 RepID=UPI002943C9FA|nr:hypothetical protein [Alteromonas sp. CI.11.F.A3]WOI35814.1 hypothetical protein R1T43_11305 [Alteromonas sp. CI.11.F.A3]
MEIKIKMKKIFFLICLAIPVSANAGWLSFFGDVASISSAMDTGPRNITQSDLKKVNSYLWRYVERKEKLEGYEYLAEALELSNDVAHLDTAAQAHFLHGNINKALELYETRVLPTGRAIDVVYESYYRKMKGLEVEQKIPYEKLYREKMSKEEAVKQRMEAEFKLPPSDYAIWGILVLLLINLLSNLLRKKIQ